jgi:DNA invertase Pin-like site-specific DNA recombinase
MRIAIYSRKSIETDTGESIKNQIKLCKEYFKRQYDNCTFEIFEDEGFSGGNINRPSFQRMMELVRIKQFDIVAVYKIDRIARNIVDFVNVYDKLENLGVQLVSITEGFDPSTPAGKMMMLLLASFAEMERMNIAQRVKDNMRELAKLGHWSGGTPPTGYITKKVIENGKKVTYLELNQDVANDIKIMFKKYTDGYSTYQISKLFKNKGLNYPQKTIHNLLSNPTYLVSTKESIKYLENQGYTVYGKANGYGFLPYNRRPRTKGKKSWNDKSKFVGISKHKAIIALDLWISVQDKLKERTVEPHPRESEFTFLSGGIVKCKCGSSMFVSPGRRRKDGTRTYYFRCMSTKNIRKCNSKFLRIDVAEKSVYDAVNKLLDKDYLIKFIGKSKETKNVENEIKTINKKIKTNEVSINNLVDKLMILSNDAATVITKKIEELTNSNILLKESLLKLERKKRFETLEKDNVEILHNQINKFINSNDIGSKRILIKTIIKQVVWDSESNTIHMELLK